jgi:BMFP domain-containing protein YqiC
MQSENRIFDDLAKMLNGVAGTVAGMGREAQENAKTRAREWAGGLDLVTREEFDAVKQIAANARAEAELLAERVEKLEAALGIKAKPAAKAAPKTAAKTVTRKPKAPKA